MVKQAMAGADPSSTATTYHTPSCADSCSNNNSKLYKGVRKRKWGKWVSEIRLPNSRERIWLGSYDTQEKAARAFDAALYCLRGRHASFNFPDTPLNLEINVAAPGDQSLSPQEIQEVAAKFANDQQVDPPHETQEPSESQRGANSFDLFESNSKSNSVTEDTTTSSSSVYEYDHGIVQVDHGDMRTMDWTFLNMLDDANGVAGFDYGLYSGLDKMHSGELLYSTPPQPPFEDDGDEIEGDDAFSHHSFLWSWNF